MAGLDIVSYNCRGLPKSRQQLALRPDIVKLFKHYQIIAFQEIWYSKQNLNIINSLHNDFDGVGVAKVDESDNIVQGRYSGGVAIMWHKKFSRFIKRILFEVDWCVAIEISMEDTKFIIFNIYMPYQIPDNDDRYVEYLGYIKACLDDISCTNFAIIGDWNANLGTSGTNLFKAHMTDFCISNSLQISSFMSLPCDTYTHVQNRENNIYCSWLDHIVTSLDMHNSINNIEVLYGIADEDHIPVMFNISVSSIPKLTSDNNSHTSKINWDCIPQNKLKEYCNKTSAKFDNIKVPVNAICCSNCNCTEDSHKEELEQFYNNIVNCLKFLGND